MPVQRKRRIQCRLKLIINRSARIATSDNRHITLQWKSHATKVIGSWNPTVPTAMAYDREEGSGVTRGPPQRYDEDEQLFKCNGLANSVESSLWASNPRADKCMRAAASIVLRTFGPATGTLFSIFFISIVVSAFRPHVCYEHPGGARSVISEPSILCDYAGHQLTLCSTTWTESGTPAPTPNLLRPNY
eukprot:576489-Amphidinium_carterae.1